MCLRGALYCGTSSRSRRNIPSLQDPLGPFSADEPGHQQNQRGRPAYLHKLLAIQSVYRAKVNVLFTHISCCAHILNLLTTPDQPLPPVNEIHLFRRHPGFGLVIWRDGDTVLPPWCRYKTIHFKRVTFWNVLPTKPHFTTSRQAGQGCKCHSPFSSTARLMS